MNEDTSSTTRTVVMRRADTIADDVPTWAWEYDGRGRIAVGTVVLGAGRPGAGKSTWARWLVAQATTGLLPGCWLGRPVNVAYLAREEAVDYVVKPSLRAHAANLERVYFPEIEVTTNGTSRTTPVLPVDMDEFTTACRGHGVQLVVVDPLMSTIGSTTDVNRNNEVRAQLDPWRELAEAIDGVVIGVAHLNKSGNGDVVAGINGSSAFGEVARAVFGFAKDPESESGERVLSQEKNSLGDESLALRYRIDSATVRTDSGRTAEVGKFTILGTSDRTVGDVLREAARPAAVQADDGIDDWLREILADGPVPSAEVYKDADASGYSKDKAKRAKSRLGVTATKTADRWVWSMPDQGSTTDDQGSTRPPTHVERAPLLPSRSETVQHAPLPSREQGSTPTREAPPGGLTLDSPGQSERVARALAHAEREANR